MTDKRSRCFVNHRFQCLIYVVETRLVLGHFRGQVCARGRVVRIMGQLALVATILVPAAALVAASLLGRTVVHVGAATQHRPTATIIVRIHVEVIATAVAFGTTRLVLLFPVLLSGLHFGLLGRELLRDHSGHQFLVHPLAGEDAVFHALAGGAGREATLHSFHRRRLQLVVAVAILQNLTVLVATGGFVLDQAKRRVAGFGGQVDVLAHDALGPSLALPILDFADADRTAEGEVLFETCLLEDFLRCELHLVGSLILGVLPITRIVLQAQVQPEVVARLGVAHEPRQASRGDDLLGGQQRVVRKLQHGTDDAVVRDEKFRGLVVPLGLCRRERTRIRLRHFDLGSLGSLDGLGLGDFDTRLQGRDLRVGQSFEDLLTGEVGLEFGDDDVGILLEEQADRHEAVDRRHGAVGAEPLGIDALCEQFRRTLGDLDVDRSAEGDLLLAGAGTEDGSDGTTGSEDSDVGLGLHENLRARV